MYSSLEQMGWLDYIKRDVKRYLYFSNPSMIVQQVLKKVQGYIVLVDDQFIVLKSERSVVEEGDVLNVTELGVLEGLCTVEQIIERFERGDSLNTTYLLFEKYHLTEKGLDSAEDFIVGDEGERVKKEMLMSLPYKDLLEGVNTIWFWLEELQDKVLIASQSGEESESVKLVERTGDVKWIKDFKDFEEVGKDWRFEDIVIDECALDDDGRKAVDAYMEWYRKSVVGVISRL